MLYVQMSLSRKSNILRITPVEPQFYAHLSRYPVDSVFEPSDTFHITMNRCSGQISPSLSLSRRVVQRSPWSSLSKAIFRFGNDRCQGFRSVRYYFITFLKGAFPLDVQGIKLHCSQGWKTRASIRAPARRSSSCARSLWSIRKPPPSFLGGDARKNPVIVNGFSSQISEFL